MGAAEIIPGISGGTIALILGIYKRLIIAISSIDKSVLRKLLRFEYRNVWSIIDGNFLLFLGLGMVSSVCLLYTSPNPRDRTRSRMPSSA